jgi:hypothetical protein
MRTVEEAIKDKSNFKCTVYKKDIVPFLKYCFANGIYWGRVKSKKDLYRSRWQWNHTYFIYASDGLGYTQDKCRVYTSYDIEEVNL